MKTPSNFCEYPWASVTKNSESETIALNIMKILERTGNQFRNLTWEEYKSERLNDGNFSERERLYFERVINYCISPDTARLFSQVWEKIYSA